MEEINNKKGSGAILQHMIFQALKKLWKSIYKPKPQQSCTTEEDILHRIQQESWTVELYQVNCDMILAPSVKAILSDNILKSWLTSYPPTVVVSQKPCKNEIIGYRSLYLQGKLVLRGELMIQAQSDGAMRLVTSFFDPLRI